MFDEDHLVSYLLRHRLVCASSVVEGDLDVIDLSRRNHNFGVLRQNGQSYLVKQGVDADRNASIANEAKVYQFFDSDAEADEFSQYLPRYFGYDPSENVLFLEFLANARDLQKHHARVGRFSSKIAATMGLALSLLHRKSWSNVESSESGFQRPLPWVFSIHHPDIGILRNSSEANLQVIRIIQGYPEFCDLLDGLRDEWQVEALVHSDLKWDNCLVLGGAANGIMKIVDWELAGLGDPVWDVGSIFSAYLTFWLLFVPISASMEPADSLQLARYPLETMQPALRSFWRTYARGMQLDSTSAERSLLLATKYAAARLAQTSYEQMYASPQLIGNVVGSLQLSLNILKHPRDASIHLLGIPPASDS